MRSGTIIVACLAALVAVRCPAQQADPAGHWRGAIEVPGSPLAFDVRLERDPAGAWTGTISIPAQDLHDYALAPVEVEGERIRFVMPGIPGTPTFEGWLEEDGRRIAGTFTQGDQRLGWSMRRAPPPEQRTRDALQGLEQWLDGTRRTWNVPGLAMAIVQEDRTVFLHGTGLRDVERSAPVTPDTLFAIGSTTKALTSFVLGTLVDEGVLDWDRPIVEDLPEFRLRDEMVSLRVTLRDVLSHRTGLPRHDLVWYGREDLTPAQAVAALRHLEASAGLRERWQYNNLLYIATARLVEAVTGRDWEALVRERIFEPLGMERSNFDVEVSRADADFAWPYADRDGTLERLPFRRIRHVGPAGAINSSAAEMARWLVVQLNDGQFGGRRLIEPGTLRQTHQPQVLMPAATDADEVVPLGYALGWMVDLYRGHRRVHHAGGIDGFSALVTLLPAERIGIVVLCNASTALPTAVTQHAIDRLLALEERDWSGVLLTAQRQALAAMRRGQADRGPRAENTSPSRSLDGFAGLYAHPAYGTLSIRREREGLAGQLNGLGGPLQHWHYDTFAFTDQADEVLRGLRLTFMTDADGRVEAVRAPLEPAVAPITFTRRPDGSLSDPDYLAGFEGAFAFAENGPRAVFTRRGEALTLFIRGQPEYRLVPTDRDRFAIRGLPGFGVEFERGPDGQVARVRFIQPNGTFEAQREP